LTNGRLNEAEKIHDWLIYFQRRFFYGVVLGRNAVLSEKPIDGLAICSEEIVTINHSESWRAKKQQELVYAAGIGKSFTTLGGRP